MPSSTSSSAATLRAWSFAVGVSMSFQIAEHQYRIPGNLSQRFLLLSLTSKHLSTAISTVPHTHCSSETHSASNSSSRTRSYLRSMFPVLAWRLAESLSVVSSR